MKIFYSFGLLICPWPSPLSGRGGRVERVFVVRTVPSFEWRRVLYVQLYEWLYVEKKKKNSWSKKNHENPISSSEREVSRWYPWWQSFPKMYFTLLVKKKRKKKQEKETEERKIFLLSANFRSRVSLSDFIVVFSELHLAEN